MSSTFDNLHVVSAGNIVSVADLAALPSTGVVGDVRYVVALDALYAFDGISWNTATTGISALTGDVTAAGSGSVAATVAKIQGTTVSGTTGTGNVVFSASPTVTGTLTAATISASGTVAGTNLTSGGHAALDLALTGGTMSGDVAMGSHKVTGLGAPSVNGDALRYDQLGANSGIATLDSGGKVPLGQLPASLMEYQGTWNATTNTPTLADGTGTSGFFYRVQTAGTQNLGSGSQTFVVADWVMYNGAIWQLAHAGADAVLSVNGAAGVVTVNAINQLTGDVTTSAASGSQSSAATVAKIQSTVVSGTTGTGNVMFSASPTTTGTLTAAAVSASGAVTGSNLSGTNTGDQTITLTGNVTGSGTGSFATAIAANAVTNTMLAGSIAYSKLTLTGAILNADLAGSIAYSKLTLTGAILNADISASAAIAGSKITTAVAGTSAGVMAAGGTPGNITGTTIASGYVGETTTQVRLFSNLSSTFATASPGNVTSALPLPVGVWMLYGAVGFDCNGTASITNLRGGISTSTGALPSTDTWGVQDSSGQISFNADYAATIPNGRITHTMVPAIVQNTVANKNYYLVAQASYTGAAATVKVFGSILAVRIA